MAKSKTLDGWFITTIKKFRALRSSKLEPLAQLCIKTKIRANHITALSLIFGLTSIYFLFTNFYLFTLFALLHLFADALDGVIARLHGSTKLGEYFDWITDSLIAILAMAKTGWYLNDFYPYIIAALFALCFVIFLWSKLKAPLVFIRSASLGVLIVGTIPNLPYHTQFLTFGYLVGGVFTVFSFGRQIQWFFSQARR